MLSQIKLLRAARDYKAAYKIALDFHHANPSDSLILKQLSEILFHLGDKTASRQYYEKTLDSAVDARAYSGWCRIMSSDLQVQDWIRDIPYK